MSIDVDKIKKLLDEYFVIRGDIVINPETGIVDVTDNKHYVYVELTEKTKINTLPVQFGRVAGEFYCCNNKLTSLKHAPTSVGGNFYCYNNQLTSLEHTPTMINGVFDCGHNQLTSLEHAPTSVGGSFYCTNNQLTSLEYAPTSVGVNFYCNHNKLTSLKHAPTSVGGNFNCSNNQLTSLQGATTSVGGNFNCDNNQFTSLQGVPKSINGTWFMTVYPNTPLLRLLLIQGIEKFLFMAPNGNDDIHELNRLFKKYYPQGRQGILKCGLEMMSIKNGKYATNARMGPK